ncbi:interleukin-7 isoform X1 [Notechis scutatus]|uniref:Interleukin-7 isoform X1 n=2 Tax=Notechis scutatus TaxID=8663 RepID=A0A6J1VW06_9SAUR|nr:interleukin-7 isoform X1 [Notechis scutatus]
MSHVIHENVEEYRTQDLNPLVSCLIPHSAFLRYIFMILPLFLVLAPEASSDNMTEIRKAYDNLLVGMISHLEELISENITSSCNLNKRYHSFENANITFLTSCLKKKANCTKFASLKTGMNEVSELTTKILKKTDYTLQPVNLTINQPHRCCRQCRKIIRNFDNHTLCCLKNVVSALSSWWKRFLYYGFIPTGIK